MPWNPLAGAVGFDICTVPDGYGECGTPAENLQNAATDEAMAKLNEYLCANWETCGWLVAQSIRGTMATEPLAFAFQTLDTYQCDTVYTRAPTPAPPSYAPTGVPTAPPTATKVHLVKNKLTFVKLSSLARRRRRLRHQR